MRFSKKCYNRLNEWSNKKCYVANKKSKSTKPVTKSCMIGKKEFAAKKIPEQNDLLCKEWKWTCTLNVNQFCRWLLIKSKYSWTMILEIDMWFFNYIDRSYRWSLSTERSENDSRYVNALEFKRSSLLFSSYQMLLRNNFGIQHSPNILRWWWVVKRNIFIPKKKKKKQKWKRKRSATYVSNGHFSFHSFTQISRLAAAFTRFSSILLTMYVLFSMWYEKHAYNLPVHDNALFLHVRNVFFPLSSFCTCRAANSYEKPVVVIYTFLYSLSYERILWLVIIGQ